MRCCRIRHAGAVFLGHRAPEALGDYVTGSNHVLPTSRASASPPARPHGLPEADERAARERGRFRDAGAGGLHLARGQATAGPARSITIRTNAGGGDGDKNRLIPASRSTTKPRRIRPGCRAERRVAIFDLIEQNDFKLIDKDQGPLHPCLSQAERRLVFAIPRRGGE
ncbi:MAG: UPF0262 family protein [Hyphomonas sp.]